MRGDDREQGSMFSYRSLEDRVPLDHPLRPMRAMVDLALEEVSPRFAEVYASTGRPSIPPERLLRALLLQILFSVRSERQLMEELEYNLLYRWFVGLGMDDPVWVPTTFTKNRDRLLEGDVARAFFDAVLAQAADERLLSSDHFSVDGTLVEAWASHKSFRPKSQGRPNSRKKRRDRHHRDGGGSGGGPRNPSVDFRGERRLNDTHASTTDPEARMARMKGEGAKLAYQGHVLMENRHGLVVDARLTEANGYAERETALEMLGDLPEGSRVTLGADRGYDTRGFVEGCRALGVTPHVAQHTGRASRIDGRTTRHAGYAESQKKRKRIEEIFGWMKTVGLMRKTRHRGQRKVDWVFVFTAAAYNLVRIRNLAAAPS